MPTALPESSLELALIATCLRRTVDQLDVMHPLWTVLGRLTMAYEDRHGEEDQDVLFRTHLGALLNHPGIGPGQAQPVGRQPLRLVEAWKTEYPAWYAQLTQELRDQGLWPHEKE
jgi:hypothetical protein